MKLEYNNGYKTVTSEDGMILYNKEDGVITDEIIMPIDGDVSIWEELSIDFLESVELTE